EFETRELNVVTHAEFVPQPTDVHERREFVATRIEQLHGGKSRSVLIISRIPEPELNLCLREESQIMVLQAAAGVAEMPGLGDSQAGVVIVVLPPEHVIAIQLILLDPQI